MGNILKENLVKIVGNQTYRGGRTRRWGGGGEKISVVGLNKVKIQSRNKMLGSGNYKYGILKIFSIFWGTF